MPSRLVRLPFVVFVFALSCTGGRSAPDTGASRSSASDDLEPVRVQSFEVMSERWLQLTLDYCGRDYRLEVQETGQRVEVLVEAPPPSGVRLDCAVAAAVILDEPVGNRRVANVGTGGLISQLKPE